MSDTESSNNAPGSGAARGLLVRSAGPAELAGLAAALRSAGIAAVALPPGSLSRLSRARGWGCWPPAQRWGSPSAKPSARVSGFLRAGTVCVRWT